VFEIAALTAPLIKVPHDSQAGSGSGSEDAAEVSAARQQPRRSTPAQHAVQHVLSPPVGALRVVLLLSLRLARGWAPAVVVAQGVRLVGTLVQKRQHPNDDARQEGTEGEPGMCVFVATRASERSGRCSDSAYATALPACRPVAACPLPGPNTPIPQCVPCSWASASCRGWTHACRAPWSSMPRCTASGEYRVHPPLRLQATFLRLAPQG
jgi:hypothetical protein